MAQDNSEYGSPASAKRKADTTPSADNNDNLAPPAKRVKTPTEDVADPIQEEQEAEAEAEADVDDQGARPFVSRAASGKSSPIEFGRRQQQQQHQHHQDDLLTTADVIQPTPSKKSIPPTTLEGHGDEDGDIEMPFLDEPHFVDNGPEDHSETDKPAPDTVSAPGHDHHQPASAAIMTPAANGSVDVQVISDPTEAEHDHNSEVASSKDAFRPEPLHVSSFAGKGLDAVAPSSRPVSLAKDQAAAQVTVSQFWVATLGKDQREKALASCAPSTYLNDDVINACLEMLTSRITHLRTLSTLLVDAEEKTLQQAIRRIPPLSPREKGIPAQPGNLSHLVLTFGFQPVHEHWGLAWLDFDSRTADIYDSNPSVVEGQFQKACRQVRRLIKLLPAPYNLDTEWSIQAAPFVTQSNYEDCGVYTIAAAFYRAAGLCAPVPGPSVDGSLWRLICKSFLIDQPSSSVSEFPIFSVLGDFVPKFNDQVPLPSAPVATGPFIAAADVARNVEAHYRYIRELQDTTVETFAARRTSASDVAKLIRFVRDVLVPVSDADDNDAGSLQQTIKQLENEETCGDSALTSLQRCNSMSFMESIKRLQNEVDMVRKCKMGAKARHAAMRHSRGFFMALGNALGLMADKSDQLADKYSDLMGPMRESLGM